MNRFCFSQGTARNRFGEFLAAKMHLVTAAVFNHFSIPKSTRYWKYFEKN